MNTLWFKLPWKENEEGYELTERVSADELAYRLSCDLNEGSQLLKDEEVVGKVFPEEGVVAITDKWVQTLATLGHLKKANAPRRTATSEDTTATNP